MHVLATLTCIQIPICGTTGKAATAIYSQGGWQVQRGVCLPYTVTITDSFENRMFTIHVTSLNMFISAYHVHTVMSTFDCL